MSKDAIGRQNQEKLMSYLIEQYSIELEQEYIANGSSAFESIMREKLSHMDEDMVLRKYTLLKLKEDGIIN